VNGTTGYEEAAGQGAIAGVNAAMFARDEPPLLLSRDSSYVGVLIDDLVTRGVDEPYRLFTSRAEFRLTLRQDNALRRLASVAIERGLLNASEQARAESRLESDDAALALASNTSVRPEQINDWLVSRGTNVLAHAVPAAELAKRAEVPLGELFARCQVGGHLLPESVITADLEIKYAGYFARERAAADRMRQMSELTIPEDLPYEAFRSMSIEARQKLAAIRPLTLAHAARIPGVSPSDLQNLLVEMERRRREANVIGSS
jgi:tRNA uridine 5-carboxymethylaminomethyl modification enzyme